MKIEIIFFFAAILIVGAFLLIIIEISKKQTKKIDIEKYRVKWLEIQNQINKPAAPVTAPSGLTLPTDTTKK